MHARGKHNRGIDVLAPDWSIDSFYASFRLQSRNGTSVNLVISKAQAIKGIKPIRNRTIEKHREKQQSCA